VHGLIVSGRYMVPTAELLAAHYRVFVPDLPSFGKSEKPPRTLDVAGLSDSLAAWMGEGGLDRAALVGNPFGCQIIVELAPASPRARRAGRAARSHDGPPGEDCPPADNVPFPIAEAARSIVCE
jgi:2-hydroxy-6-oxonona-2,4-dienedioate hydrolase